MPFFSPALRTRVAIVASGLGFVGFSAAAVLNQGVGRLAAIPEDAKVIQFNDVPAADAPPPTPGDAPVADAAPPPDEDVPSPGPRAPSVFRAPALRTYTDAIVRRNIFDSTAVYDPNAATRTDGGGECKDGGARLLATVVADEPTYSSALIVAGGKDSAAAGFVVGDEVAGEGRIVTIEQKRVCLDGGSCLCMGGDAPRKGEPVKKVVDGEEDSGITKLSDNRWAVEQSVLDGAIGNFEMLASQIKAYAHKGPDGQVDGYRLSSIRPSSVFAKLGIKNGDIVHGVNGTSLTSMDGAMAAFQSLKNEKSFSFDITRKNQKQTLEYEVR